MQQNVLLQNVHGLSPSAITQNCPAPSTQGTDTYQPYNPYANPFYSKDYAKKFFPLQSQETSPG